ITDYSSIYLEGLLRDVPPVFIPYDQDSYERGMPLPYDQVTPGPKPASFAELLDALGQALEGASAFKAERDRVKQLYFEYQSGDATRRVISLLENEILKEGK
ncbi:MAG: CDP-glycerol glycerophosphotransferase family protein, partial [Balneolales bacterium]|nr:CDP-glycerol glycerophosphotransferase family protein [Balneolales bacterium]